MNFKKDFLANYLKEAPVSLSVERTLECQIFSKQEFISPILDLGCGEGLFAYILFDEKIDVGVEPNAMELKRAEEYGIYNELINCYGNNIPKESGSFNTIFSNSVLEHIPDVLPVLREVHRLLTSEGRFYVTVPSDLFDKYSIMFQLLSWLNLTSLAERYRGFFNKFWKHYHYYDLAGWTRLFEDSGFQVVEAKGYGNKGICLLDDLLVPFSIFSFITKKFLNRWFLLRSLRSFYAPLLHALLNPLFRFERGNKDEGLLCFCLKKIRPSH